MLDQNNTINKLQPTFFHENRFVVELFGVFKMLTVLRNEKKYLPI